jgi:hypothetical protein
MLHVHDYDKRTSASGPGMMDLPENLGSTTNIACVRCRQVDYGHVLIPLYRPTSPVTQSPGPRTSILGSSAAAPQGDTRDAGNGQGQSGPSRPHLSGMQEAEI